MAEKVVTIDWKRVDNFLKAQCSGVAIASMLGIHENTLYDRCKEENGVAFVAYSQEKKAEGKELLRAKQYQVAMDGDKSMLIWLGKQYLDQRDKKDITQEDSGNIFLRIMNESRIVPPLEGEEIDEQYKPKE